MKKNVYNCIMLAIILLLVNLVPQTVQAEDANAFMKQTKVSLVVQKATIRQIFNQIEDQTSLTFFYRTDQIDHNKEVNVDFEFASLQEVFNLMFKGENVSYNLVGNQIIIRKNAPPTKIESLGISKIQSIPISFTPVKLNILQGFNLKGKVTDDQGVGLPGVNIILKGTTVGTTTDFNGIYSFNVPDGNATLIFSFIGYTSEEVAINNQNEINVSLSMDIKALQEVVVVGYGTEERRNLTSAVTTVTQKDFIPGAFNSPLQMIDGRVPGVTISNPAAADPNRGTDIQIRGASSFTAGNSPLIVIDGMPGGDLRNVAQQDIESITVLRDAASAAIYGSRGANGVILVTTKRGKAGKVIVSYDSFIDHDQIAARPDILSPEEFLERGRDSDKGARTIWYDEIIRENNFGQNHSLAVSGGNENSIFRISTNFRTKEGIDIATDRKEYGLRASFTQRAIEGLLEFDGNLSYRVANEEYTNYGAFNQAVRLNPTLPIMDPNDPRRYNFLQGHGIFNPVQDLKARENGADRTYSIIDLTARVNLLKNLSTEIKVARQSQDMLRREYYNSQSIHSIDTKRLGRARLENERWIDYTFDWLGNYHTSIGKHNIKILGGYAYQEFNNQAFHAENEGFLSDAFGYNNLGSGLRNNEEGLLGMGSSKNKEKTIAFLSRLNYNFEDTYFLTSSLRYEGNTKFGENNKWGLFPSISAGWRISSLPVFENIPFIDDLKVRLSYGETGRSGFDRYTSLSRYQGWGKYQNDAGEWIQVWGPANNYNPDLQWERAIAYNAGIDFGLLENRVNGSIDLFVRKSSELINEYTVPVPPYLHDRMFVNVGTQSARGIEMSINWNVLRIGDFTYNTNITGSYTKSKLDKLSKGIFQSDFHDLGWLPSPGNPGNAYRLEEGTEIGNFYGYKYAGVDENGNMLIWKDAVEGSERIDATNEAVADRDKTYIGNGMPKYELAWNNTFGFKSIDLSLFFRGRFDYQIMNLYQMYYGLQAEGGVNLLRDAYGKNDHIRSNKIITDYFLESGDFFRLDNITLGWSPDFGVAKISSFRIYGTVRNVFTITKYTGLDPTTVGVTGMEPGLGSLDLYPFTRNYALGVQVAF